ncbi:DUF447 domain-containing protein [Candidatus Altiarchaeota archaeon]
MKEKILEGLGFKRDWIYEVIVSTIDQNKQPHAAPIGIFSKDMETISMNLYPGSETLENILKTRGAAVNFTSNLELINKSVSGEEILFDSSNKSTIPVIKDADAYLMLELDRSVDQQDFVEMDFKISEFEENQKPQLLNRAEMLFLEALIKFTKKDFLGEDLMLAELCEIQRVIKKTAPNSKYEKMMEELLEHARD